LVCETREKQKENVKKERKEDKRIKEKEMKFF
jgi:hypothetical protein